MHYEGRKKRKVCAQTNTISDLNTFMWVLFYRGLYPFLFTSQNIFMDSQIAKCKIFKKIKEIKTRFKLNFQAGCVSKY